MNVELSPGQRAFAREAVASGRLRSEEDAIAEALALWEERERRRAEILAVIDEAESSLARGEGLPMGREQIRELAAEVNRRGRERLQREGRI